MFILLTFADKTDEKLMLALDSIQSAFPTRTKGTKGTCVTTISGDTYYVAESVVNIFTSIMKEEDVPPAS